MRFLLFTIFFAAVSLVSSPAVLNAQEGSRSRSAFTHPGIFTSQEEMEVIRQRVAQADPEDPTYAGYVSTMDTRFADVTYEPQPSARPRRRDKKPIDSTVHERDSAMVAYTLALKWLIDGDEAARDKSIEVMDAWSKVFEKHEGDVNTYLDCAWVVTVWSAAGELMLHGEVDGRTARWPRRSVERFKEMIRKLESESSVIITKPFNPVSNWGTSSMLGSMAAGIFLDDRAMYEKGRDAMLKWLPKILWEGGWSNEVDRDPWHGVVSLTGVMQAAEVGRHQGDLSIYHAKYDGQEEPRLLVSMKWYADPLRMKPVAMPKMRLKPEPWEFVGTKATAISTGGFEMALNYYKHIEPTPGLEGFEDMVLTMYRPSGQNNSLFIESDTLTHADLYKPGLRYTMGDKR